MPVCTSLTALVRLLARQAARGGSTDNVNPSDGAQSPTSSHPDSTGLAENTSIARIGDYTSRTAADIPK